MSTFKIESMQAAKPFTSDAGNTSLAKCKVILMDGAITLDGSVYSDSKGTIKSGIGRGISGTLVEPIREAILQSYAAFKIPAPAQPKGQQQQPTQVSTQQPDIAAMIAAAVAQALVGMAQPQVQPMAQVKKSKGVKLASNSPEPSGF